MASRTVVDPRGLEWFVLEVPPDAGDAIDEALSNGWLVARSGKERRRIAPVPANWQAASDPELLALIKQAPVQALASHAAK